MDIGECFISLPFMYGVFVTVKYIINGSPGKNIIWKLSFAVLAFMEFYLSLYFLDLDVFLMQSWSFAV